MLFSFKPLVASPDTSLRIFAVLLRIGNQLPIPSNSLNPKATKVLRAVSQLPNRQTESVRNRKELVDRRIEEELAEKTRALSPAKATLTKTDTVLGWTQRQKRPQDTAIESYEGANVSH